MGWLKQEARRVEAGVCEYKYKTVGQVSLACTEEREAVAELNRRLVGS